MSMLSRFATLGGAPTDPYWANVTLLLPGNNFTDYSSSQKTITNNSAVISTAVKKYGTGSMGFNGTNSYLASPNNSGFSFGTGNFTVEGWIYTVAATTWGNLIATGTDSNGSNLGWKIGRYSSNSALSFGIRTANDFTNYNGTTITWNNNTWYYFAAVRSGTTLTLYWDGASAGVFTGVSAQVDTGSGGVSVGCRYGSTTANPMEFHNGNIADLRVTKGVARYSGSTMTVPTGPLPTTGP